MSRHAHETRSQLSFDIATLLQTLLLEEQRHPLPRNINNSFILHSGWNVHFLIEVTLHSVLNQLLQHTSQRLPRPCLWYHAATLDHTAQRGDGPNLVTDLLVNGIEELLGWGCREVISGSGGAGRDEGEGEVAFHGIGDADYAGFGYTVRRQDGLFDCAYEVVSRF